MTVAPVVVKPDIVSKKAFVTLGMLPLNRYGIIPTSVNTIHATDTTKYPSRRVIVLFDFRPMKISVRLVGIVMIAV